MGRCGEAHLCALSLTTWLVVRSQKGVGRCGEAHLCRRQSGFCSCLLVSRARQRWLVGVFL